MEGHEIVWDGPLVVLINEMSASAEHHFSENKEFDGFWEGHYSYHWAKRYKLWNHIDMPRNIYKYTNRYK